MALAEGGPERLIGTRVAEGTAGRRHRPEQRLNSTDEGTSRKAATMCKKPLSSSLSICTIARL
jgi:hypothetical protein